MCRLPIAFASAAGSARKPAVAFICTPKDRAAARPTRKSQAIIDAERERAGITPRTFTDEEIMRRYMAAMINEGANVVHEGIALRPLDVDVTFLYGYGFPALSRRPDEICGHGRPCRRFSLISASSRKKTRSSGKRRRCWSSWSSAAPISRA